ncbi:Bet_v_1 domain-containing protein [Cephalotus follicularis]|uniref:Bet_v_1 domain-containing protein n=1 Tax=Cephalotus follicularis TaxID=3775 RepID=A0A1Q3CXL7_CEPFO|nr:Bet_v_1 domain-containing protein [Cephalotus follicularis]
MAQSSLCGTVQAEVEIKAPADKVLEFYSNPKHFPKCSPATITSVDLHGGRWGTVGSITTWNYVLEGKTATGKGITEAIDYKNKTLTMNVIEGDIMKDYKSFKFHMQAIPKGDNSLVRFTYEYEKLNDDVPDPKSLMEIETSIAKDVGAYLTRA